MMEPDAHTLSVNHDRKRNAAVHTSTTTALEPAGRQPKPPKEPRSKAGWLALLFVVALVAWMGSGYLGENKGQPVAEAPRDKVVNPFTVEAFESKAKAVTQFVAAEGQAMPDRQTPVRAKTGGTIEEIVAKKGQFLNEGDVIARIALADRSAQISQAEAELSRRQGEFDRVSGLVERGYSTRAELESAEAELAVARASLASIRQTQGDTEIRAPITGVLEDFNLDLGEFIAASAEVGTQVDINPLTVEVQVAQQGIGQIKVGQTAQVNFITGASRQGEVTYVASNAKASTRTFPVEITIPNPDRDIPAGISAEVRIPVGETPAHFLSAAILALGPNGELGIKAVDENSKVKFYPAELVRAETDGIWVNGLPDTLRIISVGQGFVSDGETVNAVAPTGNAPDIETPADAPSQPELPDLAATAGEASGENGSGLLANRAPDAQADADASQMVASNNSQAGNAETTGGSDRVKTLLEQAGFAVAAGSDGTPPQAVVRMAQEALNTLGYEAGPTDGVMGTSTRDAIRAFQEDKGLDATGTLNAALATALTQAIATGATR
ncbi:efflux RND transporter periplasmic adaptor subunit [Fulvimarina sp. MAC3]|uniref:efflux RND transporter periplasmic adaptor subunit n=1 Tax=Fulvimarina sp. MAC3 TaxID=3148887 RepID=UPI0031FDF683